MEQNRRYICPAARQNWAKVPGYIQLKCGRFCKNTYQREDKIIQTACDIIVPELPRKFLI